MGKYQQVKEEVREVLQDGKAHTAEVLKGASDTCSAFDLSDFEIVKPAFRKEAKQVISVFDNGDLALNASLRKVLKTNQVEIYIKKDCSQILLIPEGKVLLDIAKNNRIKNYRVYEKLKDKKMKFPVYYVGEWEEEHNAWLGDLVTINPNKTKGKVIK